MSFFFSSFNLSSGLNFFSHIPLRTWTFAWHVIYASGMTCQSVGVFQWVMGLFVPDIWLRGWQAQKRKTGVTTFFVCVCFFVTLWQIKPSFCSIFKNSTSQMAFPVGMTLICLHPSLFNYPVCFYMCLFEPL